MTKKAKPVEGLAPCPAAAPETDGCGLAWRRPLLLTRRSHVQTQGLDGQLGTRLLSGLCEVHVRCSLHVN